MTIFIMIHKVIKWVPNVFHMCTFL
jgi:hypothetical protein